MAILSEHIQDILDTLAAKPGYYKMKDDSGKSLYFGKVINLYSLWYFCFYRNGGYKRITGAQLTKKIL